MSAHEIGENSRTFSYFLCVVALGITLRKLLSVSVSEVAYTQQPVNTGTCTRLQTWMAKMC